MRRLAVVCLEAARTLVVTQGHWLNRNRVNNVVSNMPEFDKPFPCKTWHRMVRASAGSGEGNTG
jgi:hypothetical protein